jgi:hypothetical protein
MCIYQSCGTVRTQCDWLKFNVTSGGTHWPAHTSTTVLNLLRFLSRFLISLFNNVISISRIGFWKQLQFPNNFLYHRPPPPRVETRCSKAGRDAVALCIHLTHALPADQLTFARIWLSRGMACHTMCGYAAGRWLTIYLPPQKSNELTSM